MKNENGKNIVIVILSVVILVLVTLLIISLTGVLNLNDRNISDVKGNDENQSSDNIDQENNISDTISYEIVREPIEGTKPTLHSNKLYVNDKLVPFKNNSGTIIVDKFKDILIVEQSLGSAVLYAVDKDANIIGVFAPENNNYYENIQKIVTKANYRDTYRIDSNDLYVTTDKLSQDPHYVVCNMITNDDEIVVYEEKFEYLGNNKFSNSEVVNTTTRRQYMQEHNITCN